MKIYSIFTFYFSCTWINFLHVCVFLLKQGEKYKKNLIVDIPLSNRPEIRFYSRFSIKTLTLVGWMYTED